jgi:hypothetical protein
MRKTKTKRLRKIYNVCNKYTGTMLLDKTETHQAMYFISNI